MGKVWKRDGPAQNSTIDTVQHQKLSGKTNVWKRGSIAQPTAPKEPDARITARSSRGVEQKPEAQQQSLSPAAKRRRLAAQGRSAQQPILQNGPPSHPDAAECLRGAGHSHSMESSGAGEPPNEAEIREQALRREAETLRRQIAEEETRLSDAKVGPVPSLYIILYVLSLRYYSYLKQLAAFR